MSQIIKLTQGKVAIVDDEDFEVLAQYKWSVDKTRNGFYAVRVKSKKKIYMHRQIVDAQKGVLVDHVNHNGLDNQRSNLRLCTYIQNSQNMKTLRGGSSKFKGVSWASREEKWLATYQLSGKKKYIGYFEKEEDAAMAYDIAVTEDFGEFALTNKMLGLLNKEGVA